MNARAAGSIRAAAVRAISAALLCALSACGGAPAEVRSPSRKARPTPEPGTGLIVPALRASEIARVPEGTFGPYVGESRDGALVVWAAEGGEQRGWYTLPVNIDGKLRGAARR